MRARPAQHVLTGAAIATGLAAAALVRGWPGVATVAAVLAAAGVLTLLQHLLDTGDRP